jgi:hypothetical protein
MNKNTETAYQSAKDYADAKTSPEMTQLSTDISTLK